MSLWDVEHMLSLNQGNPAGGSGKAAPAGGPPVVEKSERREDAPPAPVPPALDRLPESYIPPVIAVLPRLARNDPDLEAAAANSGTSIPRAFEKSVHAAFRVLGYDCTLLGQGGGRVPDGRAVDHDHGYALLWDAKAYRDGYTLGTDDRAIREYLDRGRREVPRSARNLYFVLVSGGLPGRLRRRGAVAEDGHRRVRGDFMRGGRAGRRRRP